MRRKKKSHYSMAKSQEISIIWTKNVPELCHCSGRAWRSFAHFPRPLLCFSSAASGGHTSGYKSKPEDLHANINDMQVLLQSRNPGCWEPKGRLGCSLSVPASQTGQEHSCKWGSVAAAEPLWDCVKWAGQCHVCCVCMCPRAVHAPALCLSSTAAEMHQARPAGTMQKGPLFSHRHK